MATPNTFSNKTGQISLTLLDENFEYIDTQLNSTDTQLNSTQVKIGTNAGETNQGQEAVAIGSEAGNKNQEDWAVALGYRAGNENQGEQATALGPWAANINQGWGAVAVGTSAGDNYQGDHSVALGNNAGAVTQGTRSVALGFLAAANNQGNDAIAIGNRAGYLNQHDNSIVLNATSSNLNSPATSSLTIKPIRSTAILDNTLGYNPTTGEVVYGTNRHLIPRIISVFDEVSGCPPARAAGTQIMRVDWTMERDGYVEVRYQTIANYGARIDHYIYVDGVNRGTTLTSTNSSAWKPINLIWCGALSAGTHSAYMTANQANATGCGTSWGRGFVTIYE